MVYMKYRVISYRPAAHLAGVPVSCKDCLSQIGHPVLPASLVISALKYFTCFLKSLHGGRIELSDLEDCSCDRTYLCISVEDTDMVILLMFDCRGKPLIISSSVIEAGLTVTLSVTPASSV